MPLVADAAVAIRGDLSKFSGDLKKAEKQTESLGGKLNAALSPKALVGGLAGGLAVSQVFSFFDDAIDAASNLEQATGAVEAVLGDASGAVKEFGETSAESFGLSRRAVSEMGALMGAQLQGMGYDAKSAADEAVNLQKRAADMAATFGGPVTSATEAISALMRGERDTIEKYGVSIKEADVQARILSLGLDTSTTAAAKNAVATASLSLLYEQTAKTAGSFARESDTLAGQQARSAAKMEDAMARLGEVLLPLAAGITDFTADALPALIDGLIGVQKVVTPLARLAIPVLVAVVGIKLVAAFHAAKLAGVESATAIKLAWGAVLLGIPMVFEGIRGAQQQAAADMKDPRLALPWDWLIGSPFKTVVEDTSRAVEAASARWAGNTRSFIDREVDEWGRLAQEIPPALQAAGDAANAIISSSASGFSAVLEDGRTIFAGSAEVLAAELPHALSDAKARAEAIAAAVPKDLADTIIGNIDEFDAAREAIIDAFTGAVSDAQAAASDIAILSMPEIAAGFAKGSTEANSIVLGEMDKLLASLQILQPAAFEEGTAANKALPAGFAANIEAAVAELGKERDKFAPSLSLEGYARVLGHDGLADYIGGMQSVDVVTPLRLLANSVLHELEVDAGPAGKSIGDTWGDGLAASLWSAYTKAGIPLGRIRGMLGGSLPTEGPLQHPEKGGRSIAEAWIEKGLVASLRAGLSDVTAALPTLSASGTIPASVAMGAAGAASGAIGASGNTFEGGINITAPTVPMTARDIGRELRRTGVFRDDGRLG